MYQSNRKHWSVVVIVDGYGETVCITAFKKLRAKKMTRIYAKT